MICYCFKILRTLGIAVLFFCCLFQASGAEPAVEITPLAGDWVLPTQQSSQFFRITNDSDQAHTVTIELNRIPFFAKFPAPEKLLRTMEIPPRSTTIVALGGMTETPMDWKLNVQIDRETLPKQQIEELNKKFREIAAYGSEYSLKICLSQQIPGNTGTFPASVNDSRHESAQVSYFSATRSAQDYFSTAAQFYDASLLIMKSTEFQMLKESTRTELLRAIAMGLPVVFIGVPPEIPGIDWQKDSLNPNIQYGYRHFGKVFAIPTTPEQWSENEWDDFLEMARLKDKGKNIRRYVEANTQTTPNAKMPPILLLLAFMIFFFLVVGPINYFYLKKKNSICLLVLTVPILSIVLTLFNTVFLQLWEGTKLEITTDSVTFLDQLNHEATTLGTIGFYSPTRKSDLAFRDDVLLVMNKDFNISDITIDTSSGFRINGNYLQSRKKAILSQASSRYRPEELKVTEITPGSTMEIVNGLGSKIHFLAVRDSEGNLYKSTASIDPGQRATLQFTDTENEYTIFQHLSEFAQQNWKKFSFTLNSLGPNMYSAQLESSPFLETGSDVKPIEENVQIIGIYAPPAVKEATNEN